MKQINKSKISVKDIVSKMFWVGVGVTLLFVVFAFGFDAFNNTSSIKFTASLKDSDIVDVLVITSEPYDVAEWDSIRGIVLASTLSNTDIVTINKDVAEALNDYSILTVLVTRQVEIMHLNALTNKP